MKPGISVAMCTYNGQDFLASQLQSIANQTRLPDELIISDDGSTDSTLDLLSQFSKEAPFPVHIHQNVKNLGVAGNFTQTIDRCQNEFIALVDQDDIWFPERLEKQATILEANTEFGYTFSNAQLIDAKEQNVGAKLWNRVGFRYTPEFSSCCDTMLKTYLRRSVVTGATMMLRKSITAQLLPVSPYWIHDQWIVMLCATAGIPGFADPATLINYRIHAAQSAGVPAGGLASLNQRSLAAHEDYVNLVEAHRKLLHKATELPADIQGINGRISLLKAKLEHVERRLNFRNQSGLTRWISIMREASTGGYSKYANSIRSIASDLFG